MNISIICQNGHSLQDNEVSYIAINLKKGFCRAYCAECGSFIELSKFQVKADEVKLSKCEKCEVMTNNLLCKNCSETEFKNSKYYKENICQENEKEEIQS